MKVPLRQLERALEHALVPYDVREYPEAGHSFRNNHLFSLNERVAYRKRAGAA